MTPFQEIMLNEVKLMYPMDYRADNKGELLTLYELQKIGMVELLSDGKFRLTQQGYKSATC